MNPELSQLLSLQEADLEIKRITEEITSLPARQQLIEGQFADSVKEHLDQLAELESTVASRARLEADLATENQKHEKFKADLMKARNEKEYATAVREIDASKKAISTFESDLIKHMERLLWFCLSSAIWDCASPAVITYWASHLTCLIGGAGS